eukprot:2601002-Pleurochrysis_carterae.AAC.5
MRLFRAKLKLSRSETGTGVGERKRRSSTAPVTYGGVCARGPVATVNARRAGRLLETSALLPSIDERFTSATPRLDFRSPLFPPRCLLPLLRLRESAPRSRSRRLPPRCLIFCSIQRILGSFSGFALSVYCGL